MDSIIIYLIIGVVLILAVAAILSSNNSKDNGEWKSEVRNQLAKLSANVDSKDKLVLYHSLVEVDKLLDHTLKQLQVPGRTMGERLKNGKHKFDPRSYNDIWEAHKIRNNLVHEVNYHITNKELKAHFIVLSSAITNLSR
jgi:hypothetical protein